MNVGVLKLRLRIPENHSLKGKRKVLHSVTSQISNKFHVSVAEVDDHDLWQVATVGVSCVSNSGRHANEVLSHIVDYVQTLRSDAEVLDYEIEILHAL